MRGAIQNYEEKNENKPHMKQSKHIILHIRQVLAHPTLIVIFMAHQTPKALPSWGSIGMLLHIISISAFIQLFK